MHAVVRAVCMCCVHVLCACAVRRTKEQTFQCDAVGSMGNVNTDFFNNMHKYECTSIALCIVQCTML
jgi:hypothetical protein